MLDNTQLDHLEKVSLRNAWKNEALDFTPWLAKAENLAILGEAVGIEFELVGTETAVGTFAADIVCKDTVSGGLVLIENQLEQTDHGHLGQILTYAAGLDVEAVVWIAKEFNAQHRAALDWLNEVTDDRANFFGLEIELWRIGDSALAPKFNVVSQPNEWTRGVEQSTKVLTDWQRLQLDFWTGYHDFLFEHGVSKPPKPAPQSWMAHPVGRSGYTIGSNAANWDSVTNTEAHVIRVELAVYPQNAEEAFEQLMSSRPAIEAELGESLVVSQPENQNTRTRRFLVQERVDLNDKARWPEYYDWLWKRVRAFDAAFRPRIRDL